MEASPFTNGSDLEKEMISEESAFSFFASRCNLIVRGEKLIYNGSVLTCGNNSEKNS
jgi:hypothetical protein